MIKIIFKIKFVSALFIFGIIFSGCNKSAVNTAQNSNVNQNIADTSASAGSSTEKNANSVINNETENTQTNTQTSATPDKEQKQKTIDQYIAGVAKVSDAEEYKEARKVLDGDLDGDGDEDTAVQFTIEGMGGGNILRFLSGGFQK